MGVSCLNAAPQAEDENLHTLIDIVNEDENVSDDVANSDDPLLFVHTSMRKVAIPITDLFVFVKE